MGRGETTLNIVMTLFTLLLISGCVSDSWYDNTIPEPTTEVLYDALGNHVKTLTYEGTHNELESIIFAINKHGDNTIAGHDSLKSLGRGHTTSASSPMTSLVPWAHSNFSTEPAEIMQNENFREHLINISVLTEDYNLTENWQGNTAIIFIIEGYEGEDVNRAHELSHVFYHNLDYYRVLAFQAVNSLSQEELDCMVDFLDHYDYSITQENVADETVAYYLQGDNQTRCFNAEGPDMNNDGYVTEGERYLWDTTHP